jgi:putative ABC transport system permease protein
MRVVQHSLRSFGREWRAGELATLLVALTIAVAAMSAVGFFTERVRTAMQRQASEALAADLVIGAGQRLPTEYEDRARGLGLRTARTLAFPSGLTTETRNQLAEVRAVGAGYPLRGKLRIADQPYGAARVTEDLPGPGEMWAEVRILAALDLAVGDSVRLGGRDFTITQVLDYAPDQGFAFVDLAPLVMVRIQDLEGSELIGPASRVGHRLLMAGEPDAVEAARTAFTDKLGPGERLRDVREGNPQLGRALDRADRFLRLAALVSVLLAAVAVAMAARRYAQRETDVVAIMKALGARQREVLGAYALQLAYCALLAGAAGALLGWAAQAGLIVLLGDLLPADLPAASWWPVPAAFALASLVLAGFALPPVLQLGRTPPLRVLRHDAGPTPLPAQLATVAALAAVIGLLWWQTRDALLATYVLGGIGIATLVFALAAWGLVWLVGRARGGVGVAWRYGLANVARRGKSSVAQLVAFGIGIMVLLLLTLVRSSLLETWQDSLPDDLPNHFLVNIQSDEQDRVRAFFRDRGLAEPELTPMIRGRMIAIDGIPVEDWEPPATGAEEHGGAQRARNFVRNEANLTWRRTLAASNKIVDGEFWPPAGAAKPSISLEYEVAAVMGLKPGSTMTYDIGGEQVTATVTSIREVDWQSFEPNFFVMFSPGAIGEAPHTFLTAVHLPPEQAPLLFDLVRELPSITIIDLDAMIKQVRDVIRRASLTVEYVFLFTLAAGILVLLAAVQGSREERRFEAAVLRTLGASRRTVFAGVASEFVALGLLAGFLAAFAASAVEWTMAAALFDLPWTPSPVVALVGLALGTLFVGATGVLATRSVVTHPPVETLRRGG